MYVLYYSLIYIARGINSQTWYVQVTLKFSVAIDSVQLYTYL